MMRGIEHMGITEMPCVGKVGSLRPREAMYGERFDWKTTAQWMLSSNAKRQNMGVKMAYPTNRSNSIVAAATQVENSSGTLRYTSYEANAWRLELPASGARILVDPWLVGPLTFGGLDMIFKGEKKIACEDTIDVDHLAANTDFILLTMSIDDHAHRPTLKRLPKNIPVVGSPSAAAVAREMGYKTVYELRHGQEIELCDGKVAVKAVKGALVGPPWSMRENGYVITEKNQQNKKGIKVFYEPHADYVEDSIKDIDSVDVVVMPPCTQSLLGYDLVKGATEMVPLLKRLKPKVVIPLMNAEFNASGPLSGLISEIGGVRDLETQLSKEPELKESIKVKVPKAGEPMEISI